MRCNFCGRHAVEVVAMVASADEVRGGVGICDDCVASSIDLLAERYREWGVVKTAIASSPLVMTAVVDAAVAKLREHAA